MSIMAVVDKTGKKGKTPRKGLTFKPWLDGIPAIPATDLRKDAHAIFGRVEHGGEEIILTRRGKPTAALVSMAVLKAFRDYEDAQDIAAAEAAEREIAKHGTVSLNELKAHLKL